MIWSESSPIVEVRSLSYSRRLTPRRVFCYDFHTSVYEYWQRGNGDSATIDTTRPKYRRLVIDHARHARTHTHFSAVAHQHLWWTFVMQIHTMYTMLYLCLVLYVITIHFSLSLLPVLKFRTFTILCWNSTIRLIIQFTIAESRFMMTPLMR